MDRHHCNGQVAAPWRTLTGPLRVFWYENGRLSALADRRVVLVSRSKRAGCTRLQPQQWS